MVFYTNTNIAPIVNVSTYDGPFGYESLWQDYEEDERREGRFVCDDYDFSKMGSRIVEEANLVFKEHKPLDVYGVSKIEATSFGSPREYNFMTDWLNLKVTVVKKDFFRKAKAAIFDGKHRKDIVEYAGEHWVSYDGFCSSMLNRIQSLSRDHWKHTHYGTHMATDPEVEAALMADLTDAFDHLENGTGDDDFREFGAILALLWLIEYPSDFKRDGDGCPIYDDCPIYGSWMTDEMLDHLTGNSSLSEFCTILEKGEVTDKVKDAMIDFNAYRTQVKAECDKYLKCGVGKASQEKAKNWLDAVLKEVDGWESKQTRTIEFNVPKWDEIKNELAELREEWDAKLEVGWPGAWK